MIVSPRRAAEYRSRRELNRLGELVRALLGENPIADIVKQTGQHRVIGNGRLRGQRAGRARDR